MANDNNQPGTNLANGSVIFVALLATGAYFFHREAPLLDSRPAETDIHEREAPQTIVARLWQDPFEAVYKALDKPGKPDPHEQCQGTQSGASPSVKSPCESPLKGSDVETLVLGVTVPGPPYQEDAERRRRTRYAVLAGLERAGFVPKDARHIDYFVWKQSPASLETSPALSPLSSGTQPAWNLAPATVESELPLVGLLQVYRLQYVQAPVDPALAETTIVPYERFEKDSQMDQVKVNGGRKSILVLWIREDSLRGEPLKRFTSLIESLHSYQGKNIKIIGPYSSDILHDMYVETRTCQDVFCVKKSKWPRLTNVSFYAYGASAADNQILENHDGTVQNYFAQFDIDVQRTIATDDTLAGGIVSELNRREVYPDSDHKDHVALISEWDTFYGQTVPAAVERKFAPDGLPHSWISKFTYLRGLGGLLPSADGKEDKRDKATTSTEKQGSTTEFFNVEKDTQSLERPIGQSQFDYLRRISEHLHKLNDDLKTQGPDKRIKAIGILSGDVFDKLLILRALRPEFPDALFFTTDFDEAFAIKSELPFTRNLIISSSFGPNLNDTVQGEIPPFRDTYQASAFLAAQLAIGDTSKPANSLAEAAPVMEGRSSADDFLNDIAKQLLVPRIFEIERSGHVLPFSGDQDHDRGAQESAKKWPCWSSEDLKDCANIQPVNEKLFRTIKDEKLAKGIAGGAIFVLALLCFHCVRKRALVEMGFVVLALVVGALACAYWEPVAQFLTENGKGAPIAILEGVSVWPTVLLRILGIILSLYFIWRARFTLRENLANIAKDMGIDSERKSESQDERSLWKKITSVFDFSLRSLWKKITSVFDFSLGSDQAAQSLHLNVEAAWEAYVGQERFWLRFIRASLYTIVMLLFVMYVLVPMFGEPVAPPVRGYRALNWYMWTTYGDVILMHFLTFFVFDATLFCLLFVNKQRHDQMAWPPKTMEVFNGRLALRLQSHFVHDLIDLEFVAKRTRCIGSLIYFPFVLIALLIVSRSTVFANYAPCLTILIAQGISLCVVFGCAIMLCWAATAARDTAKQKLADGVIFARGHYANARGHYAAEQLETLLSRVDQLKEGAFSPFSQQPLVRAVLLPLGTFGWKVLMENGMLPGL